VGQPAPPAVGPAAALAAPGGVEEANAGEDVLVERTADPGPDLDEPLRRPDLYRPTEEPPPAGPLSRPDGPAAAAPPPQALAALPQAPSGSALEVPHSVETWPRDLDAPPAAASKPDQPAALVREDALDGVWLHRSGWGADGEPDAGEADFLALAAAHAGPEAATAAGAGALLGYDAELRAAPAPAPDRPVALAEAALAAMAAGGLVWWSLEWHRRRQEAGASRALPHARLESQRLLLSVSSFLEG
jgi:hypothetical protein